MANSLYDFGESIELLESLESHLPNTEPLHSRETWMGDGECPPRPARLSKSGTGIRSPLKPRLGLAQDAQSCRLGGVPTQLWQEGKVQRLLPSNPGQSLLFWEERNIPERDLPFEKLPIPGGVF